MANLPLFSPPFLAGGLSLLPPPSRLPLGCPSPPAWPCLPHGPARGRLCPHLTACPHRRVGAHGFRHAWAPPCTNRADPCTACALCCKCTCLALCPTPSTSQPTLDLGHCTYRCQGSYCCCCSGPRTCCYPCLGARAQHGGCPRPAAGRC